MNTLLGLLALGFVLGLKHALDADHLAAVATILGQGAGLRRASSIGILWGLGHTASLLVLSSLLIVFHVHVPEKLSGFFELLVAVMLLLLAVQLLRHVFRGDRLHAHTHRHGPVVHAHPHFHHHDDVRLEVHPPERRGARPFLVGLLHGAAGSAAVMLLVLATVRSPLHALFFVLVFGVGSIGGMLVMSALLSLPLAAAARRSRGLLRIAQGVVAGLTILVGASMIWAYFLET